MWAMHCRNQILVSIFEREIYYEFGANTNLYVACNFSEICAAAVKALKHLTRISYYVYSNSPLIVIKNINKLNDKIKTNIKII